VVKSIFQKKDVTFFVDAMEKRAKDCNQDLAKFGWGPGIFDYWRRTGYKAELKKLERQIEHKSKYRNIDAEA
jgi:hypothetical protein